MSMDLNQNLSKLMEQAKEMQSKMEQAQKQLAEQTVTGQAGGNLVTVTMDCQHRLRHIEIKPAALDEDAAFLSDIIIAAYNDAHQKIEKISKEKIAQLTAGLNIPTDLLGEGNQ